MLFSPGVIIDNAGSRLSSIGDAWSEVKRGISSSSCVCVERRAAFSANISISELVRVNPFVGVSLLASTAADGYKLSEKER